MAAPCPGQFAHQLEHLGLGADIDAARRLVEQENARLPKQPLRDHHFLLIAAAQRSRKLCAVEAALRRSFWPSSAASRFCALQIEKAEAADALHVGHGDIGRDRQAQRQTGDLPVFRHQRDAGFHRIARRPDPHRLPANQDLARIDGIDAEDRAAQFRAARADQARPCR